MEDKKQAGGWTIRAARPEDGKALSEIYAPYVRETAISFEYEAPGPEAFSARIEDTLKRYPYLVAELSGVPAGYAYASAFKSRPAYDWAVETSIYVRRDMRGKGVGKALYTALESALRGQNVQNANACITWPNPESIAFHEALGYRLTAHFHKCGFKLGRWWDMVWMEKDLGEHETPPPPFLPFSANEEK